MCRWSWGGHSCCQVLWHTGSCLQESMTKYCKVWACWLSCSTNWPQCLDMTIMLLSTSSNWCIGLFENYLQIRFKDPNLVAVRNSFYVLHCICILLQVSVAQDWVVFHDTLQQHIARLRSMCSGPTFTISPWPFTSSLPCPPNLTSNILIRALRLISLKCVHS